MGLRSAYSLVETVEEEQVVHSVLVEYHEDHASKPCVWHPEVEGVSYAITLATIELNMYNNSRA